MSDPPLRPAPPDLEERAREMVQYGLSPEAYAARWAHTIMMFSLDDYQYRDPETHAWIQALGDILFRRHGAPSVQSLREKYLTEQERIDIARRMLEEF